LALAEDHITTRDLPPLSDLAESLRRVRWESLEQDCPSEHLVHGPLQITDSLPESCSYQAFLARAGDRRRSPLVVATLSHRDTPLGPWDRPVPRSGSPSRWGCRGRGR